MNPSDKPNTFAEQYQRVSTIEITQGEASATSESIPIARFLSVLILVSLVVIYILYLAFDVAVYANLLDHTPKNCSDYIYYTRAARYSNFICKNL